MAQPCQRHVACNNTVVKWTKKQCFALGTILYMAHPPSENKLLALTGPQLSKTGYSSTALPGIVKFLICVAPSIGHIDMKDVETLYPTEKNDSTVEFRPSQSQGHTAVS